MGRRHNGEGSIYPAGNGYRGGAACGEAKEGTALQRALGWVGHKPKDADSGYTVA